MRNKLTWNPYQYPNLTPVKMSFSCEQYDRIQYKYQSKDGLQLINKLALQKGNSVDLGCGTGFLASIITVKVGPQGRVVGIDPNRERINFSRIKYQDENLKFLYGSSDDDFPDIPYDIIFSNHVLHCLSHRQTISHLGLIESQTESVCSLVFKWYVS